MPAQFRIGERLYLKAPEKEDIDLFLAWFNDPDVYQYIQRYRPMGRAEEEEWFANLHKREWDIIFVICEKEQDRPIGSCGLHRLSLPNRSADLGIVIGDKGYWNRGYGLEAMGLLVGYGFDVLNLNRIGLSVYENNGRARRCYEKIGFRLEGRLRQARYWNGQYSDMLCMGLLASEWRVPYSSDAVESQARLCQAE